MIKTYSDSYSALEHRIRQIHPYDVAEIIALPIVKGASNYLGWIDTNSGGSL